MSDPRPLAVNTLTMAELPAVTGTPADRSVLRSEMPWSQQIIADHWQAFGGLQAVTAVEAGFLYRWSR